MKIVTLLLVLAVGCDCRRRGSSATTTRQPEVGDASGATSLTLEKAAVRASGHFDLSYCDSKFWSPNSMFDEANANLWKECQEKCGAPRARLLQLRKDYKSCSQDRDCVATRNNFVIVNRFGISQAQEAEDAIERAGCPVSTASGRMILVCYESECFEESVAKKLSRK
jgi:hypothetical protein